MADKLWMWAVVLAGVGGVLHLETGLQTTILSPVVNSLGSSFPILPRLIYGAAGASTIWLAWKGWKWG